MGLGGFRDGEGAVASEEDPNIGKVEGNQLGAGVRVDGDMAGRRM